MFASEDYGELYGYETLDQEYMRLYQATNETFSLVAEVPYDKNVPSRYMDLDVKVPPTSHALSHGWCCPSDEYKLHYPVKIKEFYFDKSVFVHDSFYVGHTTLSYYWSSPPFPIEHYSNYPGGLSAHYLGWDTSQIQTQYNANNTCGVQCENTPDHLYKYRQVIWASIQGAPIDTLDYSWHWLHSPVFMLEFPIIAVDSFYYYETYYCPPVRNVRIAHIEAGLASIMWDADFQNSSWQLSYGPAGFDPDSGTVMNSPMQVRTLTGLDTCTHYDVYVRGVCNMDTLRYSDWVGPLDVCYCDTASSGTGGDTTSVVTALEALTYLIPNPATDRVQVLSSFSISRIEAYSLHGRQMLDEKVGDIGTVFSVKDWPAGLYIVVIHTPAGSITKKLVVN